MNEHKGTVWVVDDEDVSLFECIRERYEKFANKIEAVLSMN